MVMMRCASFKPAGAYGSFFGSHGAYEVPFIACSCGIVVCDNARPLCC